MYIDGNGKSTSLNQFAIGNVATSFNEQVGISSCRSSQREKVKLASLDDDAPRHDLGEHSGPSILCFTMSPAGSTDAISAFFSALSNVLALDSSVELRPGNCQL
jgi:hypothetical protein